MLNWLKKLFAHSNTDLGLNNLIETIKTGNKAVQSSIEKESTLNQERSSCCCGDYGCEKYDHPVVDIELEFSDNELAHIEEATKLGGYVSKGEFIRDALRRAMERDRLEKEEDPFGPVNLNNETPDYINVGQKVEDVDYITDESQYPNKIVRAIPKKKKVTKKPVKKSDKVKSKKVNKSSKKK